MAETREAVITGIGILSCLGEGPDDHWRRLMEGRPEAGAKTIGPYVVHPIGPVDFDKQIRPILVQKCQPCHFTGGKMYERLPFDRPQTIVRLGKKLFTRIRDEKERDLIRQFLAQTQGGKP